MDMAHAIVIQVKFTGDPEEGMERLDNFVVPLAKSQPGFQRGTWMHKDDTRTGTSVLVFDTEEHAIAAAEAMQPPPDGPTLIDWAVYEIARDI
jgi:hypothetical protein